MEDLETIYARKHRRILKKKIKKKIAELMKETETTTQVQNW